jgi:glyoxylase-like metal-dependent hydrolase (beta-lactamase superfamily II)
MTPLLPSGMQFLERGWLSSNVVFLDDGQSSALIDSGYFTHSSTLMSLVAAFLKDRSLDFLINTHLHSDHCGGNFAIQLQFPDVNTLIPYGLFDAVQVWNKDLLSFDLTGQTCPKFHADISMRPGDSYNWAGFFWEIHAAPGHDHDALLFYNPDHRILISADALWANGFGVVFPEICGGSGFEEVSSTLDLIEKLNPRIVLPGHGPLIHDVSAALSVARAKIKRFVVSPFLHASHAAKVLLKFKLLEWQSVDKADFNSWAANTPLLLAVHHSFFPTMSIQKWIDGLLDDLVNKKVAQLDGLKLINI